MSVTGSVIGTGSARKRELLDAAYQYVLGNGLSDLSLRPLAKHIGSSPRVLLFLFGSKDELIRALLARAREDELRGLHDSGGLAGTGRDVWAWLADPSHRALLVLWVEGYARSLRGEPGPWAEFGRDTVRDWLAFLSERDAAPSERNATTSERHSPASADPEADQTLLLAVLRGALLDLLATGDTDRVTRAVHRHLS